MIRKTTSLTISILTLCIIFAACGNSDTKSKIDYKKQLTERHTSLETQLVVLEAEGITNKDEALNNIADYMKNGDDDLNLGLAIVLADTQSQDIAPRIEGLQNATHDNTEVNYSLYLLTYLVEKHGNSYKNDSILLALAAANNYLYWYADDQTKTQILADMDWHLTFYENVREHQKTLPFPIDLKNAPVLGKILWCNRYSWYMDKPADGVMTLEHYKEFTITPETYTKLFDFFTSLIIPEVVTYRQLATWIEFQIQKRNVRLNHITSGSTDYSIERNMTTEEKAAFIEAIKYYGKYYKAEHFGKLRAWDELAWLNKQWQLFEEKGGFVGDCMSVSIVQQAFYTVLGIPAKNFRVKATPKGDFTYSHHFPLFYNYFSNTFDSVQVPHTKMDEYQLFFTKPIWSHIQRQQQYYYTENDLLYNPYWPGEQADTMTVHRLLQYGITTEHLYRIFLSYATQTKGLFFNDKSAPHALLDSDGDGIYDAIENTLSTKISKFDTDGDLLGDLWELEHGFDPNLFNNTSDLSLLKDWFRAPLFSGLEAVGSAFDPQGDIEGVSHFWDIKETTVYVTDNAFFIIGEFYGDTTQNFLMVHSLDIQNKDSNNNYFAQWNLRIPERGHFYKIINGEYENVAIDYSDIVLYRYGSKLVFALKKDLFGEGNNFQFRYRSTSRGSEGYEIIGADMSEWITINN